MRQKKSVRTNGPIKCISQERQPHRPHEGIDAMVPARDEEPGRFSIVEVRPGARVDEEELLQESAVVVESNVPSDLDGIHESCAKKEESRSKVVYGMRIVV